MTKSQTEGKGIKDKWFIHIRINKYQIRQFHLAKRLLSENEIKRVPNKWWVSEQFVRKNHFYQDILKQYKLRGNL